MSKTSKSYEAELAAVMNALAESVADASDDEILGELKAQGENAKTIAKETRELLLKTVVSYKQKRLLEALKQYETHVAVIQARSYDLPSSAAERRQLLSLVISHHAEMQSAMTMQHRQFSNLSDADVESCLKQCKELGLIDVTSSKSGNK